MVIALALICALAHVVAARLADANPVTPEALPLNVVADNVPVTVVPCSVAIIYTLLSYLSDSSPTNTIFMIVLTTAANRPILIVGSGIAICAGCGGIIVRA